MLLPPPDFPSSALPLPHHLPLPGAGLPPQQLNLHRFQQSCPLTCSPASSPAAAPDPFCPAKPTPLPLRLTRACTTTPRTLPPALPSSPGAAGNPTDEPRAGPQQAGSRGSLPFGVPPLQHPRRCRGDCVRCC